MLFLQIVFWVCCFFIMHTYVLFPVLLSWFAKGRKQNELVYTEQQELPYVDIVLAVYNEASVIDRKITSTFDTGYPIDKIRFYIGSDHSTDATNSIIESYRNKYPQLSLRVFGGRTGKASIINQLVKESKAEILILTDANVFFYHNTIYELVKHFKNKDIALVGGNLINEEHSDKGIAVQENEYLKRENLIKYQEGILWGAMIGAFGGCFAIRREEYKAVPPNYIVDDFYLTMQVFRNHKKAINELSAVYYEDITDKIEEEFRRKTRISAGNFQNLVTFKDLLWPLWTGVSFCFISHKILRWLTPIFIITALLVNLFLLSWHWIYMMTFAGQLLSMIIPFKDWLLKKIGIHMKLFRFISHFYVMNLALLIGLVKYTMGVKTNIWKPTERNN